MWSSACQPYIASATALSDKSQEMTVFHRRQKFTNAMKQRPGI